jgi:hypothetical protein
MIANDFLHGTKHSNPNMCDHVQDVLGLARFEKTALTELQERTHQMQNLMRFPSHQVVLHFDVELSDVA